jgi:hypothetical protein
MQVKFLVFLRLYKYIIYRMILVLPKQPNKEKMMSTGTYFLNFVNQLRDIDFPLDLVSGGDIHSVVLKNLPIQEAIVELYRASERRRELRKQLEFCDDA